MYFLAKYVEMRSLKIVNTRKIEGKRARGRQKQGYMASMRRRLGQSWSESEFIQYKKGRNI